MVKVSIIVIIICAVPRWGVGQNTGIDGFNAELFQPAPDGVGLFHLGAPTVLPHRRYVLGMTMSMSRNIASLNMPARQDRINLIQTNLVDHLYGAIGFMDRFSVGLSAPFLLYQQGVESGSLAEYTAAGVGDLRLNGKWRFWRSAGDKWEMAVKSELTLPTGDQKKFIGDLGVGVSNALLLNQKVRSITLYESVGYRVLNRTQVLSETVNDTLMFGGGVEVPIRFWPTDLAFMTEIFGQSMVQSPSERTTPVEFLSGVRWKRANGVTLDLAAGSRVTEARSASPFRLIASLRFMPPLRSPVTHQPEKERNYVILFDFDSAALTPETRAVLRSVADQLVSDTTLSVTVTISGYTDSIGPKTYNQSLSIQRAENVRETLVEMGVARHHIQLAGYGEEAPLESNATSEGRRQNRRVELKVGHQ